MAVALSAFALLLAFGWLAGGCASPSGGSLKPREGDVAIPANVDTTGLIDLVVDWITRS